MKKENLYYRMKSFANDTITSQKQKWRENFRLLRDNLSPQRKEEASKQLFQKLLEETKDFPFVLSFSSMPNEIDLSAFNHLLAKEKRLLLSRVCGKELKVFNVEDLNQQLQLSKFGIWEPIEAECKPFPVEKLQCIIVPGLGFDERNMRLGYGKGHYDHLLESLQKHSTRFRTIGVGFREQFSTESIPIEKHDQPLQKLLLV